MNFLKLVDCVFGSFQCFRKGFFQNGFVQSSENEIRLINEEADAVSVESPRLINVEDATFTSFSLSIEI